MAGKLVTRESLQAALDTADKAKQAQIIGRALIVLFDRQTASEQANNTTDQFNMRGFTGADGRSGVISAKTFLKNKTMLDWQIERWMKRGKSGFSRITKYHGQLNDAAVKKAERLSVAA